MGSADGNFYALVWHTVAAEDTIKWWTVRAGGPVTAAPLLFKGDRLIVASQGGHVFSFFARDKALIWSQKTDGAILGDPVLDADDVIVASTDRSVYKFDGDNGNLLWRHRADSPLADGPAVVDHTVYQYSSGQGLLALDADTGREKWRAPDAKSFVAQVEGRVAVWNGTDTIMLLDRDTGKTLAKVPVVAGSRVVTNVRHDAIYVVGSRGRVVCVRPRGVPYLHPSKVAKGRASLNRPPESGSTDDALDGRSEETTDKFVDPFRSRRDVPQKPQ
ncbi:MAG: PQQ-like beta-propeller repeat protein [Chloroflexi bacterium]|nr:PQQ-like beta-propeller repeat protein [Chloroflexota bacterium]